MCRGRQCQFSCCLQPHRAKVRGQRQCRRRGRRRSGQQVDQCADWTMRVDRSVRFMGRSVRARRGRTRSISHGRGRRSRRRRSEGRDMDVPKRQYDLNRQGEQRQATTQAYLRADPVHPYAFTSPPGRLAGRFFWRVASTYGLQRMQEASESGLCGEMWAMRESSCRSGDQSEQVLRTHGLDPDA